MVPAAVESAPITFKGTFSGLAEVPPNASPGSGTAVVTFDPVAHTLDVFASFEDLVAPATVAHIHCCAPPGVGAGVATTVPTFPGFPAGVMSGVYSMSFPTLDLATYRPGFVTASGGTVEDAEAALLAGLLAGEAYFNIHTSAFPGGEIRANLSAVPEPATLTLVGAGLGAAALRRRRGRRSEQAKPKKADAR
jgi:hypothetical protein